MIIVLSEYNTFLSDIRLARNRSVKLTTEQFLFVLDLASYVLTAARRSSRAADGSKYMFLTNIINYYLRKRHYYYYYYHYYYYLKNVGSVLGESE